MKNYKKIVSVLCSVALLSAGVSVSAIVTPYDNVTGNCLCGATYELPSNNIEKQLSSDFSIMKSHYGINTISVYELDTFDTDDTDTNKDILFAKLAEYDMKLVVRLEKYSSAFCFSSADITEVTQTYAQLIGYVSNINRRDSIAYFALNMPVDDPAVQTNLGGLNSTAYIEAQPDYAQGLVSAVRAMTQSAGFNDAKLYLSVFYGWDNTYMTPSYQDSGADGYFMNNYSYPASSEPAGADSPDLINEARLSIAMEHYISQYGSLPLVMEYGFHTASYNNGATASQTAGLVADYAAKEKALTLTTAFYRQNYSFVQGFMYFGYNVVKAEGDDGLLLDWLLAYEDDIEPFVTALPTVKNSGFETGSDSWGITGGFGDTAFVAGSVMKVCFSDSGRDLFQSTAWFSERCRVRGLYTLSAQINTDSLITGTVKLTAEFKNNGSTIRYYSSPSYGKFSTDGWHTLSVNIPAAAEGSYDEILYKLELSSGSGKVLADNFRFVKQQSILFNGSFETGGNTADEWGMWPSWGEPATVETGHAADGLRCVKVSLNPEQNYSLYSTPISSSVVTSSQMICSVMVKTQDAQATMNLHLNRGSGETVWSAPYALSGSTEWKMYSFEVPADTAADIAQFQVELSSGTGVVYLDCAAVIVSTGISGDVNQDGLQDVKDLVRMKKFFSELFPEYVITDQNGDGILDALDIVFIRKLLVTKQEIA